MPITLNELENFLKPKGTILEHQSKHPKSLIFEKIKLYHGSPIRPNTHTILCVLAFNEFTRIFSNGQYPNVFFLVIKPISYAPETKIELISHSIPILSDYLLVETNQSPTELLKDLQSFIRQQNRFKAQSDLLTKSLLKAKNIHYLVEQAAIIFHNPIIVIDKTFRVLAHSNREHIQDLYWQKSIDNGFCSYEFITEVNRIADFQEGKRHNQPFHMACHIDHTEKLVAKLILEGQFFGYVAVLDSLSPVQVDDLPLIDFLGRLIVEQLQKQRYSIQENQIDDTNFFIELLDQVIQTPSSLTERLRYIQPRQKPPFYLLLISYQKAHLINKQFDYLRKQLRQQFPTVNLISYDDCFLLFFNTPLSDNDKEALHLFMEKDDSKAVISSSITDYLQIRPTYQACLETLQLVTSLNLEGTLFSNDDYKLLHLFQDVENHHQLHTYCHPKVLDIIHYDNIKKTTYYETLRAFCQADRNAVIAAKKLYLHRNTLHYRLRKIEQIFGLTLNQIDTFFDVLLTIKILDYLTVKETAKSQVNQF